MPLKVPPQYPPRFAHVPQPGQLKRSVSSCRSGKSVRLLHTTAHPPVPPPHLVDVPRLPLDLRAAETLLVRAGADDDARAEHRGREPQLPAPVSGHDSRQNPVSFRVSAGPCVWSAHDPAAALSGIRVAQLRLHGRGHVVVHK